MRKTQKIEVPSAHHTFLLSGGNNVYYMTYRREPYCLSYHYELVPISDISSSDGGWRVSTAAEELAIRESLMKLHASDANSNKVIDLDKHREFADTLKPGRRQVTSTVLRATPVPDNKRLRHTYGERLLLPRIVVERGNEICYTWIPKEAGIVPVEYTDIWNRLAGTPDITNKEFTHKHNVCFYPGIRSYHVDNLTLDFDAVVEFGRDIHPLAERRNPNVRPRKTVIGMYADTQPAQAAADRKHRYARLVKGKIPTVFKNLSLK